jgi:predicted aldo/keto reductase-like oxidoreductase
MAQVLDAASKSGWVDVIMTSYNFRLMHDAALQAAIESCHKAGIGLVAMKTVAMSIEERKQLQAGENAQGEADKKLLEHFTQQGLTFEQAKIKAVLEDERISSACVGTNSVEILQTNVAAVRDKQKLSQWDMDVLKEHAAVTCSSYCAGCASICDSALPDMPYTSDIMRFLMYYNSYGDHGRAKGLFAQIPQRIRDKLLSIDYSPAQARCPQQLPIKDLIAEAIKKLA